MDDDRHPPFADVDADTDVAAACPFVALEEDRDRRLDRPDRRHRCFAEMRPAPRALAHQQAYCLSPSFPACPTFQDWARREAARVASDDGGGAAPTAGPSRSRDSGAWSAPPPWAGAAGAAAGAAAAGAAMAGARGAAGGGGYAGADDAAGEEGDEEGSTWARADRVDAGVEAPPFLVARARPPLPSEPPPARPATPGPEPTPDGGFWGEAPDRDRPWEQPTDGDSVEERWPPAGAAAVAAASAAGRRPPRGGRPAGGHVRPAPVEEHGPSWERPRRVEAYPNLRTRMALPNVPPIWLALAALAIAAVALFFLPTILAPRTSPGAATGASPSASAAATANPSPTAHAASTPLLYTVKEGDTLSKIAAAHGVTVTQIMSANPSMKDPNKIAIGDTLVIPTAAPSVVAGASPSTGAP